MNLNLGLNKWAAGLLTLAITVLTGAVAIPESAWASPLTVWQFAGMVIATFVTIFLPLSSGRWAGAIKVLGSLLTALIANVVGVLTSGLDEWGYAQYLLVGLALLNALAAELGVSVRVDAAKQTIAAPEVSSAAVQTVDPKAVIVAEHDGARHAGV